MAVITQAEIILSKSSQTHLHQPQSNKHCKGNLGNVEILCKDQVRTIQQGRRSVLMRIERFRAIGNESIHGLLLVSQKQFPPPTPLRTSPSQGTHATVLEARRHRTFMLKPQALTTTNMFQAIMRMRMYSDVDEGPNADVAFWPIFESEDAQEDIRLRDLRETEIDDNTISYNQYFLNEAKCSNLRKCFLEIETLKWSFLNESKKEICRLAIPQVSKTDLETQKLDGTSPSDQRNSKDLSGDQAYWLSANEIASQASKSATPATPFVHKSRPPSQVLASLRKVNAVFPQFEGIIKERTTQKPDYVSEWCYDYAKQFVEQQLVPFYDHFKKHIQAANDTFFKEIKEFEQIFDELEAEYEQCVLDNKNLTIEKKNLLIINECLIAECLEKDICSIVLTSDIVVPPSSNCLCEDLRSACDREHTKVLELEAEISKQKQLISESEKRFAFLEQNYVSLQLKFQNYKQCIDTSSASNAIFEINKLRDQLQGKDTTIRNLDAQINIMKVLNVGSTEGSCDQQALETDRIQLKDTITSLRIQLDGLKVENVSLKRQYDELSKANTHSRTAYTEKLSALTTQHTKLQAQVTGKTSSGPSTSETPKVLAPGMYNLGSKYIPPPKRANWDKPTPLPKKKQVTFVEPPRPSLKPTQKPVVHPNKQTNVCVPMSTGVKPTSGASKTVPKRAPRNHSSLPAKSANARRVEAHHRTLNKKNRVDSNLLVKHSVSVSNLNNVCDAYGRSSSLRLILIPSVNAHKVAAQTTENAMVHLHNSYLITVSLMGTVTEAACQNSSNRALLLRRH
ncbi:hypothetical protein Tco_0901130 [Tanacetum coccineum]